MREFLKLHQCRPGMQVELDTGFTCHAAGIVTLETDDICGLFFRCTEGKHYIVGQVEGESNTLVGIYPTSSTSETGAMPHTIRLRDLSVLSYAQGYTAWHYKCPHPIESIYAPGYFKDACGMIAVGDTMMISCGAAGGALIYITRIAEPELDFTIMART